MNDYFVDIEIEQLPLNKNIVYIDPVDTILYRYKNHPSILKIRENLELNPKIFAGFDSIPSNIIKDSIAVLMSPVTNLFNTAVIECLFPSDLNYANVTPFHKKDDTTNKENYRPISISPSTSKIYERIMFQKTTKYISGSLSPYPCGFRKGYSAQHALLRLTNKLNISLDKKENIGMFMMDLSKAFYCISHELLIAKLHAYGFSKESL